MPDECNQIWVGLEDGHQVLRWDPCPTLPSTTLVCSDGSVVMKGDKMLYHCATTGTWTRVDAAPREITTYAQEPGMTVATAAVLVAAMFVMYAGVYFLGCMYIPTQGSIVYKLQATFHNWCKSGTDGHWWLEHGQRCWRCWKVIQRNHLGREQDIPE